MMRDFPEIGHFTAPFGAWRTDSCLIRLAISCQRVDACGQLQTASAPPPCTIWRDETASLPSNADSQLGLKPADENARSFLTGASTCRGVLNQLQVFVFTDLLDPDEHF